MSITQQRGAGLIEVAVALLVVSIASLGLARTLLSTWDSSIEAVQRVEAIQGLEGMFEIMRSNWAALPVYQLTDQASLVSPTADCQRTLCSAAQWGHWNLWQWQQGLEAGRDSGGVLAPLGGLVSPRLCIEPQAQWVSAVITWGERSQVAADPDCARPRTSSGRLSLSMRVGEV